ncbi:hypothetical protein E2C01_044716 [Portunus trituberculatus]|uniref:Uncharacterized protein n=1 Tax=Portunus trituberculatus TaxID=210409 RepID=A0A5B7FWB6_PORTR|nr:hypothetical protein [Portunus trituberculatus]
MRRRAEGQEAPVGCLGLQCASVLCAVRRPGPGETAWARPEDPKIAGETWAVCYGYVCRQGVRTPRPRRLNRQGREGGGGSRDRSPCSPSVTLPCTVAPAWLPLVISRRREAVALDEYYYGTQPLRPHPDPVPSLSPEAEGERKLRGDSRGIPRPSSTALAGLRQDKT